MNRENSAISPSNYMSLFVDGADQSAFGLLHFVTVTKDTKWHALKVKRVGIMEHGVDNKVALYTMTENFETGANQVIEFVHRYLDSKNSQVGLPNVLFLQMDTCTRENKNKYMFAYLESF